MKYLTLSRAQQLYIGVVLLLVLPIVLAFSLQAQLYGFYLHQFVRPSLEHEFGFTSGVVLVPTTVGVDRMFAMTGVVLGGRLEQAGCRAGDIPVGYEHGSETGFLQDLVWLRSGHAVEFQVLAAADVGRVPRAWRTIRLAPQRQ